MANKAFKFRLYPSVLQEQLIIKTFGCCRFIYNKMLADRKSHYEQFHEALKNTPAQYKGEYQFLKEVDSLALANEQMHLNTAFQNFFRTKGKVGYPKFKSKKCLKQSFTTNCVNGSIRMTDNKHIRLPKLGDIRIDGHRGIPEDYTIKSATISKKASGRYFISILTEYTLEIPDIQLNPENSIGLDYSSHDFYVDNQNRSPEGFKHLYRISEYKLAREQRKLSHMCPGSHNYQKQKAKVAKVHEHIANQRTDFIEKLSHSLSSTYDIVCLEDINLQNISQCLALGKSTMDNGFGFFRTRLEQKMLQRGKVVVKIDRFFPSSKMCHYCGTINAELKLSDREWDCACGQHILRDQNAAENIRTEGLRLLGF